MCGLLVASSEFLDARFKRDGRLRHSTGQSFQATRPSLDKRSGSTRGTKPPGIPLKEASQSGAASRLPCPFVIPLIGSNVSAINVHADSLSRFDRVA
jgi:hypothetical protein